MGRTALVGALGGASVSVSRKIDCTEEFCIAFALESSQKSDRTWICELRDDECACWIKGTPTIAYFDCYEDEL